jgi:CDP-diacylglycerol---serine O-phosphatidyltransferase
MLKKRVYLLPNIITTFALACGLFVIFKINMAEPGDPSYPVLQVSALLLLLAAVADVLDGAIARLMRAESEFGMMFDSLSDAVTFGVAPPMIMLKSLRLAPDSQLSFFVTAAAMVYTICGVLRLVRYNVMKSKSVTPKLLETEESAKDKMSRFRIFTGLPIPAAAAAAVSGTLFLLAAPFSKLFTIGEETRAIICIVMMAALGYFMISRWKFPGIKTFHFRMRSFHLVFLTVVVAIFLFYGILYYFPVIFVAMAWGYLLIAWTLSIARLVAGKRSKTLEDFEPAPDDDLEVDDDDTQEN